MKLKRPLGALIAGVAAAALCLTGCATLPHTLVPDESGSTPETQPTAPPAREHRFALSYSQDDPLNPYKTKTAVNLELATLMYEGLVALDAGMNPQMKLAEAITLDDPLRPVVTVRSDARFSDGSAVTGADVAASFRRAKESPHYQTLLRNVTSVSVSRQRVTFTLAERDPHYAACLTFPIVKSATAGSDTPIGSGLYRFQSEGEPALIANPHNPTKPNLTTILLRDLTNRDAILHGLENGSVSFYYSNLLEGSLPRTSSAAAGAPQNYLCYLGVNSARAATANADVRLAVSHSLSRSTLAKSAFSGRAKAALTPFHPAWDALKEINGLSASENIAVAVAHLQQAGYNSKSDALAGGGKTLKLELLVNENNSFHTAAAEMIKLQLAKSGISLTVRKLAFAAYKARVESGDFDLYLGSIRLNQNMSLHPLLQPGGTASWGVDTAGAACTAYRDYLAGSKSLQEFVTVFSEELPIIPVCWQEGLISYNRALTGIAPTVTDPFAGVAQWTVQ